MNKVLWSMCSCCGGLVHTYNRHFFGLFPVFETEHFPLELKKVGKLMGRTCFFLGEKNYHKMDSILRSTSRPNLSHRKELYLVMQILNLNFRSWSTCSSL